MFGQHLRINGLFAARIMLILKRMCFLLYACMKILYGQPVAAAGIVENGLIEHRYDRPPPHGGKAPAALSE